MFFEMSDNYCLIPNNQNYKKFELYYNWKDRLDKLKSDLELPNNEPVKGYYEGVRSRKNVLKYFMKDGNFRSEFSTEENFYKQLLYLFQVKDEGKLNKLEQAMLLYEKHYPKELMTNFLSIQENLTNVLIWNNLSSNAHPFCSYLPLEIFDFPPSILKSIKTGKNLILLVKENSNLGVVEGMYSLLVDWKPYIWNLNSSFHSLAFLCQERKGIFLSILESFLSEKKEYEYNLLFQLIRESKMSIEVKENVWIPANMMKVFFVNEDFSNWLRRNHSVNLEEKNQQIFLGEIVIIEKPFCQNQPANITINNIHYTIANTTHVDNSVTTNIGMNSLESVDEHLKKVDSIAHLAKELHSTTGELKKLVDVVLDMNRRLEELVVEEKK